MWSINHEMRNENSKCVYNVRSLIIFEDSVVATNSDQGPNLRKIL